MEQVGVLVPAPSHCLGTRRVLCWALLAAGLWPEKQEKKRKKEKKGKFEPPFSPDKVEAGGVVYMF